MFCNFPYEWEKYMIVGKVRTFYANTPNEIIEEAKKLNTKSLEYEDKPFFYFSEELMTTNGEIPITTKRTLEEIEQSIKIEKEKSAKLKDWENVDTVYEK